MQPKIKAYGQIFTLESTPGGFEWREQPGGNAAIARLLNTYMSEIATGPEFPQGPLNRIAEETASMFHGEVIQRSPLSAGEPGEVN